MTIIIMGIFFILIWLVTTFFIVSYIKRLKNDLLGKFSDTEKPPEEKSEYDEYIANQRMPKPFEFIKRFDANHLLIFIEREHPQVIALVLAHLETDKASVILQSLPCELRSDVSRRIATMDRVSHEILREIERVLKKKLSTLSGEDYFAPRGVENTVEILNCVDRNSKDQIIGELEEEDPELAEELKKRLTTLKKPYRKILARLKGKG